MSTTINCPWKECRSSAGFRKLTRDEAVRRLPLTLFDSFLSSLVNAVTIGAYVESMRTVTANRKCRSCSRLVRQCPQCDEAYRFLNGLAKKCEKCETLFL